MHHQNPSLAVDTLVVVEVAHRIRSVVFENLSFVDVLLRLHMRVVRVLSLRVLVVVTRNRNDGGRGGVVEVRRLERRLLVVYCFFMFVVAVSCQQRGRRSASESSDLGVLRVGRDGSTQCNWCDGSEGVEW